MPLFSHPPLSKRVFSSIYTRAVHRNTPHLSTSPRFQTMSQAITSFNETISKDHPVYTPEKGRYWLYAAGGCPYASRTLAARELKGLSKIIGVSFTHWQIGEGGLHFLEADPKEMGDKAYTVDGGMQSFKDDTSTPLGDIPDDSARLFVDGSFDPNNGAKTLRELYSIACPEYSGAFSVPVLWDTKTKTIVNNDSGEIIRILNSSFNEFVDAEHSVDLAPKDLIPELDAYNQWMGPNVNSGVYKVGLATSQSVFEEQTVKLYESLDQVEAKLKGVYDDLVAKYGTDNNESAVLKHYFLFANHITDTDIRLYTTIIRFDSIYVDHFTCNFKTIREDYPYISKWVRNLYWNYPAFRRTTSFNQIKLFYTRSKKLIPTVVLTPLGPKADIPRL